EDRPTYVKSASFDKFPFPLCGEAEKERIRKLAEELDAHRKRVQARHGLTLTGLYNVLEKLRAAESAVAAVYDRRHSQGEGGGPGANPAEPPIPDGHRPPLQLTDKERWIHDKGLVSVLKQLHDDLDAAVFAAYGWPATLTDAQILERLVKLNAERAKEESSGLIRWLRPEYQNPTGSQSQQTSLAVDDGDKEAAAKS